MAAMITLRNQSESALPWPSCAFASQGIFPRLPDQGLSKIRIDDWAHSRGVRENKVFRDVCQEPSMRLITNILFPVDF